MVRDRELDPNNTLMTIGINVYNKKLSDEEFRNFLKVTLKSTKYIPNDPVTCKKNSSTIIKISDRVQIYKKYCCGSSCEYLQEQENEFSCGLFKIVLIKFDNKILSSNMRRCNDCLSMFTVVK